MKKYIQKFSRSLGKGLVGALAISAIAAGAFSCSSDGVTMPDKVVKKKVTINVRSEDCNSGLCVNPVSGATVKVYKANPETGKYEVVDSLMSDAKGVVSTEIQADAFGNNVYYDVSYASTLLQSNPFLLCSTDTVITTQPCIPCAPPPSVCCSDLPALVHSITFKDELGSTELIQGSPSGIGYYYTSKPLLVNSCTKEVFVFTLPKFTAPFELVSSLPKDTNGTVRVYPGETFTVSVLVRTADTGTFTPTFQIAGTCGGGTPFSMPLTLNAHVISKSCNCPNKDSVVIDKSGSGDVVAVGKQQYFDGTVFTNNYDCDMIVTGLEYWNGTNYVNYTVGAIPTIPSSFSFPRIIPSGASYVFPYIFRPLKDSIVESRFRLLVTAGGKQCNVYLKVKNIGCGVKCPTVTPQDYTINAQFSNANSNCSNAVHVYGVPVEVKIDSKCYSEEITATVFGTGADAPATSLFSMTVASGSQINISNTSTGSLSVLFTAPTLLQFNDYFDSGKRIRTGTQADSTFSYTVRLSYSNGCPDQFVTVKAIVGEAAQQSLPMVLNAYSQTTISSSGETVEPDYSVYRVDTLINNIPGMYYSQKKGTQPGPIPPTLGTFYVHAADNIPLGTANNPEIRLVGNAPFVKMKLFRSMVSSKTFSDRIGMIRDVRLNTNAAFYASPDFTPTVPETNPLAGNVYILYGNEIDPITGTPCIMALMRIEEVKNGSAASPDHHRSGIIFTLIYPVYF